MTLLTPLQNLRRVRALSGVEERRHESTRYVDGTRWIARSATMCPTVLLTDGYRFLVFSREDRYEPPHVHVRKGGAIAKLWLSPVEWEYAEGFTRAEQRRILQVVERSRDLLLRAYRERHPR